MGELGTTPEAAAFCGFIYTRSWPLTASCSYDETGIAARIAERPLSFWTGLLERSSVRLAGELGGAHGFALITDTADGAELSYIFVEPEAFRDGLAAALYTELVARAPGSLHAWVLRGNQRSQRFFARRGWVPDPDAGQPAWAGGHRYTLLRRSS